MWCTEEWVGRVCARPVRTEAVLLQQNQTQPHDRRSTRPGCEWGLEWDVVCARPVRTEAVLLQHNQSHLRTVGAPAPGAKGGCTGRGLCRTRSHRGGAP